MSTFFPVFFQDDCKKWKTRKISLDWLKEQCRESADTVYTVNYLLFLITYALPTKKSIFLFTVLLYGKSRIEILFSHYCIFQPSKFAIQNGRKSSYNVLSITSLDRPQHALQLEHKDNYFLHSYDMLLRPWHSFN